MTEEPKLRIVPQPTTLSPAKALRLAREEAVGWEGIALHSQTATETLQVYLESLRRLCDATSESEVQEAIAAVVTHCDSIDHATSPAYQLQAEITRRKEWLAEQQDHQQEYEDEYSLIENELSSLREIPRFTMSQEMLTKEVSWLKRLEEVGQVIQSLIAAANPVRAELVLLEQYERAELLLKRGLPDITIGALPTVVAATTVVPPPHVVTEESTLETKEPALTADLSFLSERRGMIALTAAEYKFLEVEVLMYSLFDIFGTKNCLIDQDPRRATRGPGKVVRFALELFPDLQWSNAREVFVGSGWTNDHVKARGYLEYRGTPMGRGMGVFLRSEKPLPWDRSLIFSTEEAVKFLEKIRPS